MTHAPFILRHSRLTTTTAATMTTKSIETQTIESWTITIQHEKTLEETINIDTDEETDNLPEADTTVAIWQQKWNKRAIVATCPSWNKLVERVMPLAWKTPLEIDNHLVTFKPRTAFKYLIATLEAAKFCNKEISPDTTRQLLKKHKKLALADPMPEQWAVNDVVTKKWEKWEETLPVVSAEAERLRVWLLSYRWGQRPADLIRIREVDVTRDLTSITIRIGKTIGATDPYTLPATRFEQRLLERQRICWSTTGEQNFFREQPAGALLLTARRLGEDQRITQRAVRRGGLQNMATVAPLKTVLLFSRHTTEAALLRYLDWGSKAAQQMEEMVGVLERTLLGELIVPKQC